MFQIGEEVMCIESGKKGIVEDKEWENGWMYTIKTSDNQFFYREEKELLGNHEETK